MPKLTFIPSQKSMECPEGMKILLAARRLQIPIRFSCSACQCGTCAVRIAQGEDNLSKMAEDEQKKLSELQLYQGNTIRLSCQAKILGDEVTVDLDFQSTY